MHEVITTHIITDVQPKPGRGHNPYHSELLERPCVILEIEHGEPAWLAVEMEREPGILHRYRTSPVVQWTGECDIDGQFHGDLLLETKNTYYMLEEVPYGDGCLCRTRFDLDDYKSIVW